MAKFDFVECASGAYQYIWDERAQLARVSAFVLGMKILSFTGILLLNMQDNLLRQGLMLIPAHFVEGIVVAQIMVMAVYQKSHETLSKSQMLGSAPILASGILYLLIKLAMSFALGMTFVSPEEFAAAQGQSGASPLSSLALAALLLALLIWAFRLFWLYVPVALGYSVGEYMMKFRSYVSSFYMIGVWLLCFVPTGLILIVLLSFVQLLSPEVGGEPTIVGDILNAVVQAVTDYAMVLVSSIGMAFGVHHVLSGRAESE
jgi:hypothetical protein